MNKTSFLGRIAKFFSSFQGGLNVDENARLPESDLRKISLGNLYVYQQQGVLNTFETGVSPSVREVILGEYFGITDRDSAIKILNWLSQAPSQAMFHYAYTAFLQGGGSKSREWLNENEELKEHDDFRNDCLEKLDTMEEQYPDIEQDGIAASKEEMGKLGVLAWDAGRLNFISRLCFEQGYITKEECMQCIDTAYEMTKEVYSNWKDYAYSYVLGRTLSMGTTNMIGLADDLLTDPKSPWTYINW
jgi:hypothetical protein